MNKPNMKWSESTETTDIRKATLKSFFTEIETGNKK